MTLSNSTCARRDSSRLMRASSSRSDAASPATSAAPAPHGSALLGRMPGLLDQRVHNRAVVHQSLDEC